MGGVRGPEIVLGFVVLLSIVLFETLTLPIYPLIWRMHRSERCGLLR